MTNKKQVIYKWTIMTSNDTHTITHNDIKTPMKYIKTHSVFVFFIEIIRYKKTTKNIKTYKNIEREKSNDYKTNRITYKNIWKSNKKPVKK